MTPTSRRPASSPAHYGGLSLGSPKMMAQLCDIVITALPSAAEMRDVFFGWEGLATGFKKDGLVMDIGVTDPLETVAMAKELAAHGVQLVDAPAFGTPDDAREGRLTMVVGGEDGAVERCRPVLDKLAAKVIRAGATGSAQAAAAIADYLRAARLLAASEAIRLGGHFGFEPANLLDVMRRAGWRRGGRTAAQRKWPPAASRPAMQLGRAARQCRAGRAAGRRCGPAVAPAGRHRDCVGQGGSPPGLQPGSQRASSNGWRR